MTKNNLFSLILTILVTIPFTNAALAGGTSSAPSRIVKWKDEKGITHYGDKIPEQYLNRESSTMNQQGVVVKQNKVGSYQEALIDPVKVEQERQDKALLAAFTNPQEIDAARDRNLEMDKALLQSLQVRKESALTRLALHQKSANSFMQRKKPVPEKVTQDIKFTQDEIKRIDIQMEECNAKMDATRKRFDNDKQRFIVLRATQ